jgi:hypothetical protein
MGVGREYKYKVEQDWGFYMMCVNNKKEKNKKSITTVGN